MLSLQDGRQWPTHCMGMQGEKKKKDTFSKKQLVAGKALCQELSDLNFCVGPVIFMTLDNSHGFSESQFPPENR